MAEEMAVPRSGWGVTPVVVTKQRLSRKVSITSRIDAIADNLSEVTVTEEQKRQLEDASARLSRAVARLEVR